MGKEGRKCVHAQIAGNGALETVMEEAAPGKGKARHQGEENEDRGHSRGGADKIAAAGHLPFFAGFLAASRGCLLGLVGFCHKSVFSCLLSALSSQLSAAIGISERVS